MSNLYNDVPSPRTITAGEHPLRWSQTFIPTLKEDPADAQVPSHKLMVRAGLIRQLVAGAYNYLPLGLRALYKAIAIVREEMDRAGAVELLMPVIHPAELWQESGRYDDYGDNLMKVKDRRGGMLVLGPTHEEVITDLVRHHINSYRQLPATFYQIQTKFRDEPRPRFGVLRTREFLMKDAYSFDVDAAALNASYDKMYQAYCRIFERCGLAYVSVEAESGPIGGDASHEFMVLADNGEDQIVQCPSCGYAANLERAELGEPRGAAPAAAGGAIQKVPTPGHSTIEQVSAFLKCRPAQMLKTLIYLADGQAAAAIVRGDHEANENKLRRALGVARLELADENTIRKVTGAPVGFAGPVGLKCRIIADRDAMRVADGVTGANEGDMHLTGVRPGRDFTPEKVADIRIAADGDPCPRCPGSMHLRRGIEIGHVFKLGTKYSKKLGANFTDEKGAEHPIIMGCYGIGVNRLLASLVETRHDENGIIWSLALAPYRVLLVPLNTQNQELMAVTEKLYAELQAAGIDVLLDDRDARPGFKFKDADLIGLPLRLVVGEKGLKQGVVERKWRHEKESATMPIDQAVAWVRQALATQPA
jgi:prolyl-tRNA synthetase